jgi:hypothetical protein
MGRRIRLVGTLAILLVPLLVPPLAAGPAGAQSETSMGRGVHWLEQQRRPDGSFNDGVFDPVDLTANVVMAEVAAGTSPTRATLTWLQSSRAAAGYAGKGPGSAAKLALALESSGADASRLLAAVTAAASGESFAGVAGDYDVALAVLALRGGGRPVADAIVSGLARRQQPDGGWGFARGQPSDTNTTAVALMALALAGQRGAPAVGRGVSFLDGQQYASGGWGYDKRSKDVKAMDADSTGLVLSALSALGIDQTTKAKGGVTPRNALLALQVPSGGFAFGPDKVKAGRADQLATAQALVGLAGKTLPVERRIAPKPAARRSHTTQLVLVILVVGAVVGGGLGVLVARRWRA